ncbi:CHAT domain-containing protein [Kineococcus sp. T13]|uniref:CHAT domain-containing protein n=1 Tax=Kineococcus vitellinus TaxID=2696565 RepID=UPI001411B913|nr:CHAT domain-containing protein [Kineococcus vitellinus]NAZ75454.1 CHAT domain-containing protein [Kineococcus vitellinus]
MAGQVHLQRYHSAGARFLRSARQDLDAVREQAQALQALLEREPDYAMQARQLAVHCAIGAWPAVPTDVAADLARVGLAAELMVPRLRSRSALTALLHVTLATSHLAAGERIHGLRTLREADEQLQAIGDGDRLAQLVRAWLMLLRGQLEELGRESVNAAAAYAAALSSLDRVLQDPAGRRELGDCWIDQVFGPRDSTIADQEDALASTAFTLFSLVRASALSGLFRTGQPDEAVTRELCEGSGGAGLGVAVPPLLYQPALAGLGVDDAVRVGEALAANAVQAIALPPEALEGLAPWIREQLEALQTQSASAAPDSDWALAIALGVARAAERDGDVPAAARGFSQAVQLALDDRRAVAVALALGEFAAFLSRRADEKSTAAAERFLHVLGLARAADREAFDDLRIRALLDDVLDDLIAAELARGGSWQEPQRRRRLSVLLDLERRHDLPALEGSSRAGEAVALDLAEEGLHALSDTLGRIQLALAEHPGAGALVEAGLHRRPHLLWIDAVSIAAHALDPAYAAASAELERAAENASWMGQHGAAALARAAQRLHRILPAPVRDALARTSTVLLAPDVEVAHPLPYELLHDGEDHLLATTVLARFSSLTHLARTLDTRTARPVPHRALVLAAPTARAGEPLVNAEAEQVSVRSQLRLSGFDAPEVAESRLTAEYVLERLPHVDVLHVAAHGQVEAGTEYLELPAAERLTVDDLRACRRRRLPFVYLNTCQLGRTRYLGGGQARGLAFTLSELGAPAVLANTADVLDDASMTLAIAFYREALHQDVGSALLAARRSVLASGQAAGEVARVVVYGDPWHCLAGAGPGEGASDPADDEAAQVLRAFSGDPAQEIDQKVWQRAVRASAAGTAGPRTRAATALVAATSQAGEDDPALLLRLVPLADELVCPQASALLRAQAARVSAAGGDVDPELLEDAIAHLLPLQDTPGIWPALLASLRGTLRRQRLRERGFAFERMGPGHDVPDAGVDTLVDLLLAGQQADEEERGAVRLRSIERDLDDVAWNAVVLGHPNRFEDPPEASACCRLLARKLVERGHVDRELEPVAHVSLTGLLRFLWSTQKAPHLEHELARGQSDTLVAFLRALPERWDQLVRSPQGPDLLALPGRLAAALAAVDAAAWEDVHEVLEQELGPLAIEARTLLGRVPGHLVAFAAAFTSGTILTRNTYSSLEGQDEAFEAMEALHQHIERDNDARYSLLLAEGFRGVREAAGDELDRWRHEGSWVSTSVGAVTSGDRAAARSTGQV